MIAPSPRHGSATGSSTLRRVSSSSAGRRPGPAAVDGRGDADGGRRGEVGRPAAAVRPAACAARDDRRASGCSQSALGGGRQGEQLVRRRGRPSVAIAVDGRLALGQGAGLVEQDGVDGAHALQREPVLDEHAAAGGAFGRDRDDQRDGQAERVRAGDHQHGDGADDGLVGHARASVQTMAVITPAPQREPEQPAGGAVGDPLRARARSSAPRRPAAGCRPARCRRRRR